MVIGFDASRSFTAARTGTETYSYQLLQELVQVDRENHYRLYLRTKPKSAELKNIVASVEQRLIKFPKLWTQVGLAFEVLENPPDVLFIPAHTLPVIHRPSLKSIVTIHDLGAEYLPQYHQFPQKLYLNRSTEYAVGHATHLIAVSQATKDDLIRRFRADPHKITVVHEAYDRESFELQTPARIEAVTKKFGLMRPYFLFVGTIQPRKNLERLIEAFSMARATWHVARGQKPELVLVGKRGWLSESIYAAPKKHGVVDAVQFIDYVEKKDLPALYSGAEAFVFPSLFEGFGIPLLEAMACGAPVITSSVSSMPEVAGDAALYINPNSAEELRQALLTLTRDQDMKASFIEKGFRRAKAFSWQKTAQQTIEVFKKVYES